MVKESKVYYVGRRELMKCGQYAEIIEYIDSSHIRVRFDDGYICITWPEQFKRGQVKNPNVGYKYDVGMSKKAYNGLLMTIIERKDKNHIKVRFEIDGYEKWISSSSYVSGHVEHPGYSNKGKSIYLGTRVVRDGHTATCIESSNGKLLIKFDTGESRWIRYSQYVKQGFLFPHETRSDTIKKKLKTKESRVL